MKRLLCLATALLVSILFTGACGQTQSEPIEDIKWTLVSYGEPDDLDTVIEGTEVTFTFEKEPDQLRGSTGCNTYFAEYRINDNRLTVSQIGYTEMACLDPAGIMEQEQQYLDILSDAESYQVTEDTLTINCAGELLVYTATPD